MNNNPLADRNHEIYNNYNYTSDYNPGLINKNINNFFNDVLSKPDPIAPAAVKSEQTWNKFYKEYIEHNMLFFIIMIGLVIFLVIRYYTADYDYDKRVQSEFDTDLDDTDEDDDDNNPGDKKGYKKKLKKKYKNKLKIYKKNLYDEKQKILNIIDELSELNYEDKSYNNFVRDNYEKQIQQLESQRKQDSIEQQRQLEELRQLGDLIHAKKNTTGDYQQQKINEKYSKTNSNSKSKSSSKSSKSPLDHTIKNYDDTDDDDEDKSNYYNYKKHAKQNMDNYINGLYIETPFD